MKPKQKKCREEKIFSNNWREEGGEKRRGGGEGGRGGQYLFAVLLLRLPISLCSQLLADGGQSQITGAVVPAALLHTQPTRRHKRRERKHSCSAHAHTHTQGRAICRVRGTGGVTHGSPDGDTVLQGVAEVVGFKRVPVGEDDGRVVGPLEVHLHLGVMQADPELIHVWQA